MEYKRIEKLISEIRKRPILWDKTNVGYFDKTLKENKWKEIALVMFPKYEEKNEHVKSQIESSLFMSWKFLRCLFKKHIREMNKTPPLRTTKKSRKLFEAMQFPTPLVTIKSSASMVEEEDPDSPTSELDESDHSQDESSSPCPLSEEERPNEIAKDSPNRDEGRQSEMLYNEDGDRLFLLSLLNDLKDVPPEDKLDCKVQLMIVLKKYKTKS